MGNIPFFIRQAFLNMNRNRQRTLFVLFCIAVGVGAVVSLRSLGLMIGEALTGNLQAENRGDIVIAPGSPLQNLMGGEGVDPVLVEGGSNLFAPVTFSQIGIDQIRGWADDNGFEMLVGTRNALSGTVSKVGGDGSLAELTTIYLIEPQGYPFYQEVELVAPAGANLADLLAPAQSMVIAERLAKALAVNVGDEVQMAGAKQFTVTGIVGDEAEAQLTNPNSYLFPFGYVAYESGRDIFGVKADTIYVRVPAGSDIAAITNQFQADFKGLETNTTEDLRQLNSRVSEAVTKFITVMGIVSLLIGGIGIVNTMIVVVSRRTLEIAVLKTIGLQGNQITLMFILEALMMAVLGSVLGIFFGLGLVLILQGVAERVFVQSLTFALYPQALLMGLVTGLIVTLVFGFLPTISAGRVRPSAVLHPAETLIPQAGRLISLVVILLMTAIIGLMIGLILDNMALGVAGAYGGLVILAIALLILWVLAYIFSRLPSLGNIYLKLAQRTIGANAGRTASTLLALVIGMFSLSLILLMTRSLVNVVNDLMQSQLGGNVLVASESLDTGREIEALLPTLPAVESYEATIFYTGQLVAINGNDDMRALVEQATEIGRQELFANQEGQSTSFQTDSNSGFLGGFDPVAFQINLFTQALSLQRHQELNDAYEVSEGQDVANSDEAGLVLQESMVTRWLELEVGSTITIQFSNGQQLTIPIVGLIAEAETSGGLQVNTGSSSNGVVSDGTIPAGIDPQPPTFIIQVTTDQLDQTIASLSAIPGAIAFDVSQFGELLNRLFGQIAALPLMVAVLALFASSVIIANTVSLSTLERRREIGIMKALGLQTNQILRLLLLENGLVGLLGGLLGTTIGAIFIFLSGILSESLGSFPIFTLLGLVLLSVIISLLATIITAYGAAQEKPLIVLRYE